MVGKIVSVLAQSTALSSYGLILTGWSLRFGQNTVFGQDNARPEKIYETADDVSETPSAPDLRLPACRPAP